MNPLYQGQKMLNSLLEFLGMRHSPEDIERMRSCNALWERECAQSDAFTTVLQTIGDQVLNRRTQLLIENIPNDDPRWEFEVSPDIWNLANSCGGDKLYGLRLVLKSPQ